MIDPNTRYLSAMQDALDVYHEEMESIRFEVHQRFPVGLEDIFLFDNFFELMKYVRFNRMNVLKFLIRTGGVGKDIALNALAGDLNLN